MRRAATPKLGAYTGLAALGLLAGLVLGRPEVVALAAPFAIFVCIGLLASFRPDVEVRVTPERDRALEGDVIPFEVELYAERTVAELEVGLDIPAGIRVVESPHPVAVRLEATEPMPVVVDLQATRWGAYLVGDLSLRAHDLFGLFVHEQELDLRVPLKIYPRAEQIRELVRPLETQVFSGNQVARVKGEGIEFADLRPYVPGDRMRRINWRASARRRELWVNEHHPERNADVVIFLDSFAEASREGAGSTLDQSVRAAAALLAGYAGQRDRVGFVSFGGVVRWLRAASGLNQLYRVVDALLDTEITLNYAWKDIDLIPPGVLPPQALVVALTPLLDDRSAKALLDLRARGFDLAVVDVSPIPYADPGPREVEQLSYRLWRLRREVLRARYERVGAAIVEWDVRRPLVSAIEEASAFRRRVRHG